MVDDPVIEEAARRLARAAGGSSRVLLFGSYARGEAGSRSDLDFLVIEPQVEDPAEEGIRLRRALHGLRLAVDVIVVSERDAEEWRSVPGSFIAAALRDGRLVAPAP